MQVLSVMGTSMSRRAWSAILCRQIWTLSRTLPMASPVQVPSAAGYTGTPPQARCTPLACAIASTVGPKSKTNLRNMRSLLQEALQLENHGSHGPELRVGHGTLLD